MQVFIDTNVILEGKEPSDLPWVEIDPEGPLSVFLVPTVLKEVDKKKRDGRLGVKARAFNRLIAPAATSGTTVVIRETAPRVTFEIAKIGRIDWDKYPELDPNDPDACIVAEVLSAMNVPDADKILVSQDIHPLAMAYRSGLKTHHISVDWLAPKEPSPQEKELSRLKQKVSELQTTEPELEISITAANETVQIKDFAPLTDKEKDRLLSSIIASMPEEQGLDPRTIIIDRTYNSRLHEYRTKAAPEFVCQFSENLSRTFAQVPFKVSVINTGALRADRLIIELRSEHATIYDKYVLTMPDGPPKPKERFGMDHLMRNMRRAPALIGKHEVHFDKAPEQGACEVEVHCEDFRQGREWEFNGVLTLDPSDPAPAILHVTVTASNLHGELTQKVVISKEIVNANVSDVVDLQAGRFIVDLPMQEALNEAFKKSDFRFFEAYGVEED